LRGKVSVSSSKMADKSAGPIVLTDGACFGEAGLVARVRREATVTAIADCLMLQLDACDVEDLNIDLVEMRIHVISQILEKANFFRSLTRLQRDTLATIMDICYYPSEDIVFTEGELGTKFFIIIEGRVQMRKISPRSGNTVALAEYHTHDERPWFGELALWSTKPRAATAVCLEPTKLLVINAQHLQTFLDIVPTFASMFDTSMGAYAKVASLQLEEESGRASMDDLVKQKMAEYQRRKQMQKPMLSRAMSTVSMFHEANPLDARRAIMRKSGFKIAGTAVLGAQSMMLAVVKEAGQKGPDE